MTSVEMARLPDDLERHTPELVPAQKLLGKAAVAVLLDVSERTVLKMAGTGMLPGIRAAAGGRRHGNPWLFRLADVDALMARSRPERVGVPTAGGQRWPSRHRLRPLGPPPRPRPVATLTPLVERYLKGRQARGEIGATACQDFRTRLDPLARSFGARPLAELDRHAIERWMEETFPPLAPSSRRSSLSTVKGFVRWLVAEEHISTDPTVTTGKVRQPRRVPRALPGASVAKVIAAAGNDLRARAVILLQVGCGLRCAEVARLDVGDWDRAAGTVFVTGKFDNERLLPVPEETAVAVGRYLDVGGWTSGPLIRSRDGHNGLGAQTVSVLVTQLMARAGLKRGAYEGVSAHALRHGCASDVLDRSHDIRAVQAMLGHVHLSSTEIYLRVANLDQMRAAMAGRRYER